MQENMQEMETSTTIKKRSGRKPIEDKKIPITIYRPKSQVNELGGLSNVRSQMNEFIDNILSKENTNDE